MFGSVASTFSVQYSPEFLRILIITLVTFAEEEVGKENRKKVNASLLFSYMNAVSPKHELNACALPRGYPEDDFCFDSLRENNKVWFTSGYTWVISESVLC